MTPDDRYKLTSEEQVAEVLGTAPDFVRAKLGERVDESAQQFVELSPLVFIATYGSDGRVDVSPKGDAPGFIEVVDSTTLLVPERKGNNLAFGMRNIIETGRVGLIFVVPGQRETLRVNGTATVNNDPAMLERLSAQGKPSLLCTVVAVEECFFHCGKAMIRSKAWDPSTWHTEGKSLMVEQLATALGGDSDLEPVIVATLEDNYINELY